MASNEAEADWVKPAARFANFQATSAAAGAQGVEENKSDDSMFEQLLAAMAKQTAQTEEGLSPMRESQVQSQQAQTNFMQMMGAIFASQEHQRVTNAWVTSSIARISASSGCASEAAPEPQPIITMPLALVRFGGVTAEVTADPGVTMTTMLHRTLRPQPDRRHSQPVRGGGVLRHLPPTRASGTRRHARRRVGVLPRRPQQRSLAPADLRPARRAPRLAMARHRCRRRWTGSIMTMMTHGVMMNSGQRRC